MSVEVGSRQDRYRKKEASPMIFTPPGHDDWENPEFAQHWDAVVSAANPSRAEQLDILTTIVERVYIPGSSILDLGIGSGLVELVSLRAHSRGANRRRRAVGGDDRAGGATAGAICEPLPDRAPRPRRHRESHPPRGNPIPSRSACRRCTTSRTRRSRPSIGSSRNSCHPAASSCTWSASRSTPRHSQT